MNNMSASYDRLPEGVTRNEGGGLVFDGTDVQGLADKYGTPLFVYSERVLRDNIRRFQAAFKKIYPGSRVSCALKSAPLLALTRIVKDEGGSAEVISPGELYLAKRAGFSGGQITYNGNNKSRESIRESIESGATINADSLHELEIIAEEGEKLEIPASIGIRVNPVVSADTVEEWETAVAGSKFGIHIQGGKANLAYEKAEEKEWLEVTGIHSHIGSQIESTAPYRKATDRLLSFYQKIHEELGVTLDRIDLGGGFPIRFARKRGELPPLSSYAEATVGQLKKRLRGSSIELPQVVLEPGGSLIGTAGLLLFTVGTIKENGAETTAAVDGGANVNLRATQGWYNYDFAAVHPPPGSAGGTKEYRIVGPLCYNGDVLSESSKLPRLKEGDRIACLEAGAYTVSTMNRYNSYPLPPVGLISRSSFTLIQEGETLEDLARSQLIPDHLSGQG